MSPEDYRRAVDRAASDAGHAACEGMIPEACSGTGGSWHHRKLRSQGGRDNAANSLFVCSSCHDYIHMHPAISYENGWLVKSHSDPGAVAVRRRGRLVRLFDDGTFEQVPELVE